MRYLYQLRRVVRVVMWTAGFVAALYALIFGGGLVNIGNEILSGWPL